jgi:hypothetical protein
MKTLLSLLLTSTACFGQATLGGNATLGGAYTFGAAAPSCTVATGSLFNESFEGTGYENTWAETSTPDEDYALPGTSPCSGLGAQGLRANYSGTPVFSKLDLGSLHAETLYVRGYFYIASESFGLAEEANVFMASEDDPSTYQRFFLVIGEDGDDQLYCSALKLTESTKQPITTGEWYRWEVKAIKGDNCVFRLYNASTGTQIGTDSMFNAPGNADVRYFWAGAVSADNSNGLDITHDGIGVDNVDYLGQ